MHALKRIPFFSISDSMQYEVSFAKATTAYLQKDFEFAKSELLQIEAFAPDSAQIIKSRYLSILNYNELKEWKKAHSIAVTWTNELQIPDSEKVAINEQLDFLYSKKGLPKIKDPEKANLLSTYLPGTGQLYAGYFWEGAANVTLQLIGFATIGLGIYTKYYISGTIAGLTIYQRFYTGGTKRAGYLAEKRNFIEMKEFREKVKPIILTQEKEQ